MTGGWKRVGTLCGVVLIVLGAGCSREPEADVLTQDLDGRRVQGFAVDGSWLVYEWAAANTLTKPTGLVLRNLEDGSESALAADWPGGRFAVANHRVAWWARKSGMAGPIRVRATDGDMLEPIQAGPVKSLDLSGPWLVWEERSRDRTAILLHNVATGEQRRLGESTDGSTRRHFHPRIDGNRVVWTMFDDRLGEHRLMEYDIAADFTGVSTVFHVERFRAELSGDYVIYRLGKSGNRSLRLYDLVRDEERIVAEGPQMLNYMAFDGWNVAWAERIEETDFREVPGQPLINAGDFKNIYQYNIKTQKTTRLAHNVLAIPPRLAVARGRVYGTLYRDLPPPGTSNLATPVDLLRW